VKKIYKREKGISLIEIICALAVLSLFALGAVNLLQMGTSSNVAAAKEFDLQSGARTAMETLTNKIRYSTAVFIIPESGFSENNLSSGWDYMGVLETDDGLQELVLFEYMQDSANHKKTVLLKEQNGFVYNLEFKKKNRSKDNLLIQYLFNIYQDGNEYWTLGSEAEAMNSLQVVDWSTDTDKGRAIAIQSTGREKSKTRGRVALVLDVSGSMAYSFSGASNYSNERHNAMVKSALQLLATFAEEDNIDVAIIPYSSTADYPSTTVWKKNGMSDYMFLNAKSNYVQLQNMVKSLSPYGGTNTGDGLRRAYHALVNDTSGSGKTADYTILLSDGDMTLATMEEVKRYTPGAIYTVNDVVNRNFYIGSGAAPNSDSGLLCASFDIYFNANTGEVNHSSVSNWLRGKSAATIYNSIKGCLYGTAFAGNSIIDVYSKEYVKETGKSLQDYGVTSYFVAVSSDVSTKGVQIVKETLNIEDSSVYNPLNQEELLSAFDSIGEAIVEDLWFINGPVW